MWRGRKKEERFSNSSCGVERCRTGYVSEVVVVFFLMVPCRVCAGHAPYCRKLKGFVRHTVACSHDLLPR